MAAPPPIPGAQLNTFFEPIIGGLVLLLADRSQNLQSLNNIQIIQANRGLIDPGLLSAQLLSVGYLFLCEPFENYKKILRGLGQTEIQARTTASQVFTLQNYTQAAFQADYPAPLAVVTTWIAGGGGNPGWFADKIRNSFAHGFTKFENPPGALAAPVGQRYVRLTNFDPNNNVVNFDIYMLYDSFLRMVLAGVRAAVQDFNPPQQQLIFGLTDGVVSLLPRI